MDSEIGTVKLVLDPPIIMIDPNMQTIAVT